MPKLLLIGYANYGHVLIAKVAIGKRVYVYTMPYSYYAMRALTKKVFTFKDLNLIKKCATKTESYK